MSLSSLPREILLEITDYLDDAATNALAYTNSQIYYFINQFLYRRDVVKPQSKSLTWAAENGMEGTTQQAINAGQHFTPIPESFNIALQDAADRGHVRLVELLLQVGGINLNFRGGSLKTAPLGLAARNGHGAIVELLLVADDVDPDARNQDSLTPLHWACSMKHVSIVRQLLARDDVNFNAIGYSPLHTALITPLIAAENVEIINLLLAKDGIDVNLPGGIDRNTPLMTVVQLGLEEVAKSLLTRGDLDPNIVNRYGDHVLVTAAGLKMVDIVRLLLDHPDIDTTFVTRDGRTALMETSDPDVVRLLLDQEDIEINRQDYLGRTALCEAACYNRLEAAKLLLEREDIDVNLPENSGYNALWLACHYGYRTLVGLLLERDDIDPNFRDIDNGRTALAHVCHCPCRRTAIVRLLLSHPGTDPNAVDNNGVSILADFVNRRNRNAINCPLDYQRDNEIESLLRAAGAI